MRTNILRYLGLAMMASFILSPLGASAQFTGTNGRIFYVNNTTHNIWSINPDGTDPTQVGSLTVPDSSQYYRVSVNAAGTKIVYVDASDYIATANVDGSDFTQIGTNQNDENPTWSPDGTKIYADDGGGGQGFQDIVSMNADGSDRTVLLAQSGETSYGSPQVSPDGSTIYALGNDSGTSIEDVYSVPAGGGSATNITENASGTDTTAFDISPDGGTLLLGDYVAETGYSIDTMSSATPGGSKTTVTTTIGDSDDTVLGGIGWSPDGTLITYMAYPSGGVLSTGGIWTMNDDGSNQQLLGSSDINEGPMFWSTDPVTASTGLPDAGALARHWPITLLVGGLSVVAIIEGSRRVRLSR